jgi:acyl dehydratase
MVARPLAQGPCFEDVPVGLEPLRLVKGPLTTVHLMRWSAAMENWHRIHYDRRFAVEHDKLPDLLINGSFKQQFVVQWLKDWAGSSGWLWKVSFQFRAMNQVGETLSVWGRVTGKREVEGFGLVEFELGIVDAQGRESTPGKATVALPYRGGPALPYPFIAPGAA